MKKDSMKKVRWGGRVLFAVYLACLIYFMFFSETYGRTLEQREYHYNLILFHEIRRFIVYRDVLGPVAVMINIVGNVAVFIPFGFCMPFLFQKIQGMVRVCILTFFTSLLAETMQLLLRVGCFDVDDLLLNTVGGCIGYLLFVGFRFYWRRRNGKKRL